MTITARSIVSDAQRAINDKTGVRVPAREMVRCLNLAQTDIAAVRPDTTAAVFDFTAAEGAMQSLPDDCQSLICIQSNASGGMRPVSLTNINLLDACSPGWRNGTPKTEAKHFMHDQRTPRVFWVYPPLSAGTVLVMEASKHVTEIPEPASPGDQASTVNGDVSLSDQWRTVLLHLTLYYAYMTDLEGVQNASIAATYKQLAEQMLGVQLTSTMTSVKTED